MNRPSLRLPSPRANSLAFLVWLVAVGCSTGTEPAVAGDPAGAGASGQEVGAFTLSLHPSPLSIRAGQTDTVQVRLRRTPPFSAPIRLRVTGETKGVTALVEPATVHQGTARLVVDLEDDAPLGDAGLTVVGEAEDVAPDSVRLVLTTFGTPSGD